MVGEHRLAFTTHADAGFDVCFENALVGGKGNKFVKGSKDAADRRADPKLNPSRHVELDIDIGADAKDWNAIQAAEQLKPVETELRRIEEMVQEIVSEMDYLRAREQKLRDTNESTNERVKWFALGTMGMLVGLGAWQVIYLRAYFRSAKDKPDCSDMANKSLQVQASYLVSIAVQNCKIFSTRISMKHTEIYPIHRLENE